MTNQKPTLGALSKRAIQLAGRPGGVSTGELRQDMGVTCDTASGRLVDLFHWNHLIRASRSTTDTRKFRYFTREADALRWGILAPRGWKPTVAPALVMRSYSLKASDGPADFSNAKVTHCPAGVDHRFTVNELPAGYRSQLDPRQCRAWAAAC